MKKIFVVITILCSLSYSYSQISQDSLRLSLGYGSLYGGGIGIKYNWQLFNSNSFKFHAGTSFGLLPTTLDNFFQWFDPSFTLFERNFHFINLYRLLEYFPYTIDYRVDEVWKNKLVIPFSINLEWKISRKFSSYLGFGTIGRLICYEEMKTDSNRILRIANIYKLSAFNLTPNFSLGKISFFITLSGFLIPLKLHTNMQNTHYRQISTSELHRTFTATAGFSIKLNHHKMISFAKRINLNNKK